MGGSNSKSAKLKEKKAEKINGADKNANKQRNKNSNHCHPTQRETENPSQPTSPDLSKKPKTNGHVGEVAVQHQALENVLTEHIRTLEKEKQSLAANLPNLDLGQAASDEDNYSTDDCLSFDGDGGLMHEKSVTFEDEPETSGLRHLVKHRAPLQVKRKPTRYQRPEDQVQMPSAKPQKLERKKDKKGGKDKKDKKYNKKDRRSLSDPNSVAVL